MRKTFLLLLMMASSSHATCCAGHGGVLRQERQEHTTVCVDGTTDRSCLGTPKHGHSSVEAAKFRFKKPAQDRGQVLLSGEKAPTTTLQDSEKQLQPVSNSQ